MEQYPSPPSLDVQVMAFLTAGVTTAERVAERAAAIHSWIGGAGLRELSARGVLAYIDLAMERLGKTRAGSVTYSAAEMLACVAMFVPSLASCPPRLLGLACCAYSLHMLDVDAAWISIIELQHGVLIADLLPVIDDLARAVSAVRTAQANDMALRKVVRSFAVSNALGNYGSVGKAMSLEGMAVRLRAELAKLLKTRASRAAGPRGARRGRAPQ